MMEQTTIITQKQKSEIVILSRQLAEAANERSSLQSVISELRFSTQTMTQGSNVVTTEINSEQLIMLTNQFNQYRRETDSRVASQKEEIDRLQESKEYFEQNSLIWQQNLSVSQSEKLELERTIQSMTYQSQELTQKLVDSQEYISGLTNLQNENEHLRRDLAEITYQTQKNESFSTDIKRYESEIMMNRTSIESLEIMIHTLTQEKSCLSNELLDVKGYVDELEKCLAKKSKEGTGDSKLNSYQDKIEALERENQNHVFMSSQRQEVVKTLENNLTIVNEHFNSVQQKLETVQNSKQSDVVAGGVQLLEAQSYIEFLEAEKLNFESMIEQASIKSHNQEQQLIFLSQQLEEANTEKLTLTSLISEMTENKNKIIQTSSFNFKQEQEIKVLAHHLEDEKAEKVYLNQVISELRVNENLAQQTIASSQRQEYQITELSKRLDK